MNRKALKQAAKKQFEPNLGAIFLVLLVLLLAATLVYGILSILPQALVPESFAWVVVVIVLAVISIIVTGALILSLSRIFLNVAGKSQKPVLKDLIWGFQDTNILRGLWGYIRFEVFTFLWSLLLIIPGIIKTFAYAQMFYLMSDNEKMSAAEAQQKSIALMDGHKGEYFVLQLSFIPWILLCMITFGIAAIYVVPYIATVDAMYYQRLVAGQSTAGVKAAAKKAVAAKAVAKKATTAKKTAAKKTTTKKTTTKKAAKK